MSAQANELHSQIQQAQKNILKVQNLVKDRVTSRKKPSEASSPFFKDEPEQQQPGKFESLKQLIDKIKTSPRGEQPPNEFM